MFKKIKSTSTRPHSQFIYIVTNYQIFNLTVLRTEERVEMRSDINLYFIPKS